MCVLWSTVLQCMASTKYMHVLWLLCGFDARPQGLQMLELHAHEQESGAGVRLSACMILCVLSGP